MNYDSFDKQCKKMNTSPTAITLKVGLKKGNSTKWKNGGNPSVDILIKIANLLDCSIDYLLGRTDNPNSHKEQSSNTVNGNYNAVDNSSITVTTPILDEHQKLLIDLYNKLSPIEQVELISQLNDKILH